MQRNYLNFAINDYSTVTACGSFNFLAGEDTSVTTKQLAIIVDFVKVTGELPDLS